MPNVFLKDEQLKSHEAKLKQISTELAEHRSYPPDKKLKGKEVDDDKLKDHYLEFEVCVGNFITFTLLQMEHLVLYLGYSPKVLHFSPYFTKEHVLVRQVCHSNPRSWDVAPLSDKDFL